MDEHRLGLKPVMKRVWSPRGKRWVARVHHRYQWLYVFGFVEPATGKTVWYLMPTVNIAIMQEVLKNFATAVGAGNDKHIVLVMDGAGWHTSRKLCVPNGNTLVFLPPYSPELQPAEHLWSLVDTPLVNRTFATLHAVWTTLERQCAALLAQTERIRSLTNFHWWPQF